MKKIIRALGIALCAGFLASCATTGNIDSADSAVEKPVKTKRSKKNRAKKPKFSNEEYSRAAAACDYPAVESMILDLKKQDIAKQIDLGMARHFNRNFGAASETMETATVSIDDAFTKSIMAGVGAAAFNENIAEYPGNIYEYLLVDAFNSLNYYNSGDLETAYSRLVRVGDKQREYMTKYGEIALSQEDEASAQKKIEDASRKANVPSENRVSLYPVKPTEKNLYKTSPMADYLQIVLAAQNRSYIDDFIVRELKTLVPGVDTSSAEIPYGKGRIEVLAFADSIAQRKEYVKIIPFPMAIDGHAISFKYAWPVYVPKKSVRAVEVVLDNGESKQTVLLEDFDSDVENDVIVKGRRAAIRSITRSTTSKIVAVASAVVTWEAAKVAAKESASALPFGKSLAEQAALAASWATIEAGLMAIDAKEFADVRQAYALPANASCAGFTVNPGVYSLTVKYSNGTSQKIDGVVVRNGLPVLVESASVWAE